eukprot:7823163-Ditylum_brightwellii.AAC.1
MHVRAITATEEVGDVHGPHVRDDRRRMWPGSCPGTQVAFGYTSGCAGTTRAARPSRRSRQSAS